MEHSPTSTIGTGWERTPWHATQRAVSEGSPESTDVRSLARRLAVVVVLLLASVSTVEAECKWAMPAAVPAVPVPGQPQPQRAEPYSATFRGSFGTRAECEKALRNMLDDAINRAALLTNFPACFCDSDTPGEDKR